MVRVSVVPERRKAAAAAPAGVWFDVANDAKFLVGEGLAGQQFAGLDVLGAGTRHHVVR
jgi:hypothetical protein